MPWRQAKTLYFPDRPRVISCPHEPHTKVPLNRVEAHRSLRLSRRPVFGFRCFSRAARRRTCFQSSSGMMRSSGARLMTQSRRGFRTVSSVFVSGSRS